MNKTPVVTELNIISHILKGIKNIMLKNKNDSLLNRLIMQLTAIECEVPIHLKGLECQIFYNPNKKIEGGLKTITIKIGIAAYLIEKMENILGSNFTKDNMCEKMIILIKNEPVAIEVELSIKDIEKNIVYRSIEKLYLGYFYRKIKSPFAEFLNEIRIYDFKWGGALASVQKYSSPYGLKVVNENISVIPREAVNLFLYFEAISEEIE